MRLALQLPDMIKEIKDIHDRHEENPRKPKQIRHSRHFVQIVGLSLLLLFTNGCRSTLMRQAKGSKVADPDATLATRHLLKRIEEIPRYGYAFGHQDATAYGIGWKNDGKLKKSDVSDVTGDYPAVYGFEIGDIELGRSQNLDSVDFALMSELIRQAHRKGGIVTISWHPNNPVTGGTAWDPTPVVPEILTGGSKHDIYRAWVKEVADFMKALKTSSGKPIPIVFRPFHEMNGSWFWWGNDNCTPEEYQKLWKETYQLLTRTYQVHNLLFCYSPDTVADEAEYLKFYPGDGYVDMLGIDLYQKSTISDYERLLQSNLGMLAAIARSKDKPFAMTEGGWEAIPNATWWTEVLHPQVAESGVSWALFWRNANRTHHYGPYPGHVSAPSFTDYESLDNTMFLKQIKKIK